MSSPDARLRAAGRRAPFRSPTSGPRRRSAAAALAVGATGLWWWWRGHPAPEPFAERLWVQAPHPFITHERLRAALAPRSGERILEVGCGCGRYALEVAGWIGQEGQLEIFDLQEKMLAWTLRRAAARGLRNVRARQGDATDLPYADASIDGAYLISTLGQVPDRLAAMRELARVVRPDGRVVVGEVSYDPHGQFLGNLKREAATAGLGYERCEGGRLGYFARFTPIRSPRQEAVLPAAAPGSHA